MPTLWNSLLSADIVASMFLCYAVFASTPPDGHTLSLAHTRTFFLTILYCTGGKLSTRSLSLGPSFGRPWDD
jgi:hypothetical protein